ncbi:MAG: hypothetical protein HY053_05680 [Proteobacteria bacterium]|nr:hypothetical protein [Pseudomonadota bacterium]
MRAAVFEKSWHSQKLGENRLKLHHLHQNRSGLFTGQGFCLIKLATLLQEIAFAKLEELKLLSFIDRAEEELRQQARDSQFSMTLLGSRPEALGLRQEEKGSFLLRPRA